MVSHNLYVNLTLTNRKVNTNSLTLKLNFHDSVQTIQKP